MKSQKRDARRRVGAAVLTSTAAKSRKPKRVARRAAVALEFAIVLPLAISFVIIGADFGRAVHHQIALTNACRVGAEYAASHPYTPLDDAGWKAAVEQVLVEEVENNSAIDPLAIEAEASVVNHADNTYTVTVELTYPFETIVNWPATPSSVSLHSRQQWRRFR